MHYIWEVTCPTLTETKPIMWGLRTTAVPSAAVSSCLTPWPPRNPQEHCGCQCKQSACTTVLQGSHVQVAKTLHRLQSQKRRPQCILCDFCMAWKGSTGCLHAPLKHWAWWSQMELVVIHNRLTELLIIMNGLDLYSAFHTTQSALQKPLFIHISVMPMVVSYTCKQKNGTPTIGTACPAGLVEVNITLVVSLASPHDNMSV